MLKFVLQKMISKKWMIISLLIGNLLLIAITAANPMYSQAVLQRTLTQELSDDLTESNRYPGIIEVRHTYSPYKEMKQEDMDLARQTLLDMAEEMEVPALVTVEQYSRTNVRADLDVQLAGKGNTLTIELTSFSGLADHMKLTHGEMFSDTIEDNTIEVLVNERTLVEKNLMLGGELLLNQLTDENGTPYKLRICGVIEALDDQDPYWMTVPSYWNNVYVMSENVFRELFINPERPEEHYAARWHVALDYTQMRSDQVNHILKVADNYLTKLKRMDVTYADAYFLDTLEEFVQKAQRLNSTMLVLQIPIFMLLAAFIFMVSRQMLEMEQNEISVFKSRGAAKGQIIRIYLLQSVLIAALGIAGGVPLGLLTCKMLGASNAFLEFVQRTALPIELGPTVWMFVGAAALFSICTMVLPVFKFADVTIVAHKRQKNRISKRPWWQKIFLDVVLLAVSGYGLYSFWGQQEYLEEKVEAGAALDPILYLCSSLFMLGAGLLALRLLPLMTRLIFMLGKRWWSPAVYASFLRILRTNSNQGFLVVFLVLTVAMGIFSTQTARTINANAEERIRYNTGADVVLQEPWSSGTIIATGTGEQGTSYLVSSGANQSYTEPDFDKYSQMDGVEQATKVLVENDFIATVDNKKALNVMLMGINTKEFGETAWFKDNLLSAHWYEYLNTMSKSADAILVSSSFQEYFGCKLGDIINYADDEGHSARGIIYGFVDYWPTYSPTLKMQSRDGNFYDGPRFLIVAHLSQLQSAWGVTPYQVWINTKDSSQFLYEYAESTQTQFVTFKDAAAELVELKNDPVFQGTNGILTIGFIVILLLCATGFLIYWILSIQSRTLQFGIFRAMGMSGREILSMLFIEQLFISGTSIAAGVLVGKISATLFVPLIQIGYSTADRVLPLEIISESSDFLRLGVVIGTMILICMVILGVLISKIKITQALKLGED